MPWSRRGGQASYSCPSGRPMTPAGLAFGRRGVDKGKHLLAGDSPKTAMQSKPVLAAGERRWESEARGVCGPARGRSGPPCSRCARFLKCVDVRVREQALRLCAWWRH